MADIGVKIGVDGEKQFKQDLANCTQAGKTLDAQMKALASTFGTAENKEESYSKATKLLSEQVENQQKKVDMLSKAVEESSKQYGENSTKTLKLKEQLAKAETELSKLETTTADSALGMKDLAEEEKTAGDEAKSAGEKTSAWTVALGQLAADAIKQGFKFMVESLKSIVSYFKDATTGAAAYADEILTLSSTTGLSTDALQEYQYMAALTDTEVGTITGSLTKLTAKMSSAQSGSKGATEAFDKLGVEITNTDGSLRSADEVFSDAITALGKIENETERDALAMDVFGKSAKDLNPLIEAGGQALDEFRIEAHDVGYVLDEETLDSLSSVQDGFDRLGLAADSAKNQIGAAIGKFMLPYLNQLVTAVQDLVGGGDVETFIDNISGMLNGLLSELASALPTVLKVGGEIVGKLIMGINDMLPSLLPAAVDLITQFATFIINNLPTIVNTAVDIIIALVNGLGEAMPTLIPAAIQAIITIVDGLLSHIGDIISAALTLVSGIVEGLTSEEGLNSIIDAIPTLITSLITGILENLPKIIAQGANIVVNLVIGLIQAIPKIIAALPQIFKAIVGAFRNYDWSSLGSNIMSNLSTGVRNAATTVWNAVTSAFNTAINWIKGVASNAVGWGINIMIGIGTGIKNAASTIWNAVKNAFNTAIEWIKNLGKSALQWGKDMIQGFIDGIKNAASNLVTSVKNVASNIKSFLGFSTPEKGPLHEYGEWMPHFMEGLADGIEKNAWRVQDAMQDAYSTNAIGGQGPVTNVGGVNITVTAQNGQSAKAVANEVMQQMQSAVNARKAVFAK